MSLTVNTAIQHIWILGAANTGLAGSMSGALVYTVDGSALVSSAVTVAIAEIPGAAGTYSVSYTPDAVGTWALTVTESTNLYSYTWQSHVGTGSATTSAANAFCAEADVVGVVNVGDYTSSTKPTEAQVLGFMERRAAELVAAMGQVMGDSVVYPSTIDETTNAGAALGRHLRMANSVGAAMDAIESGGFTENPARSERVNELATLYGVLLDQLMDGNGISRLYLGYAGRSSTHISSGEVTIESVATVEQGFEITTDTDW